MAGAGTHKLAIRALIDVIGLREIAAGVEQRNSAALSCGRTARHARLGREGWHQRSVTHYRAIDKRVAKPGYQVQSR